MSCPGYKLFPGLFLSFVIPHDPAGVRMGKRISVVVWGVAVPKGISGL